MFSLAEQRLSRHVKTLESTFRVSQISRRGYSRADVPPRFHRWVDEQPNPHNKKGVLCREGKCSLMSGCHQPLHEAHRRAAPTIHTCTLQT